MTRSADRLLRSAGALSDAALRAPSELPGWTRGHVLAHVTHSADAYVWLLGLARTGREPGPRRNRAALAAALERDAALPAGRLTALLRESLGRFTAQARTTPAPAWDHLVAALVELATPGLVSTAALPAGVGDPPPGPRHRLRHRAVARRVRVLGAERHPRHTADAGLRARLGGGRGSGRRWTLAAQGPSVTAAGHRILGWLTGRLPAEALAIDPLSADALPPDALPADVLIADAPIARAPAHLLPRPPAWPQPPLPGWGRVGDDV
ncbi:maleylpyruvate isomerase N-terminal domain-containing protein [Streptomyces lasalocidi]